MKRAYGRMKHVVNWTLIRDCHCRGDGKIESDWDAGVFYPCDDCNPNWSRVPFVGPKPTADFYFSRPFWCWVPTYGIIS